MGVYARPDSPFWWIWLEGTSIRKSTRIPVTADTPEQTKEYRSLAGTFYHAEMAARARGELQIPDPAPAITFATFADWYERHVTVHKRGRIRELEILATLRKAFELVPLTAVTKDCVQEWITARARKVSAATVNRELDVLKHILVSAVPKYLDSSPIAGLKRLRTVKREMQILSRRDERKLLKVVTPADRALVLMALDTLMRLSDIVNLRREQDHGRYLTVLDPKVDGTYKVPVSSRLRQALDVLPQSGPYYFPHRRCAANPREYRNSVQQMLERACAKAGLLYGRRHGFTFHVLRHTGASRMVEAGVDLRTVQEIGGWKSLRQLQRYSHPTDKAKRRAVEIVGNPAKSRWRT